MELSIVLVGAGLLLLLSFYWIVKPLRSYDGIVEDHVEIDDKEAIFTTLNEIEFDYQTKKISEEDYKELKEDYQKIAMKLLASEDESLTNDIEINDELESEIEKEIERELEKEIQKELEKRSSK